MCSVFICIAFSKYVSHSGNRRVVEQFEHAQCSESEDEGWCNIDSPLEAAYAPPVAHGLPTRTDQIEILEVNRS